MKTGQKPKFDRRGSLFGGLVLVDNSDEKILLAQNIRELKAELDDRTLLNPGAVHNNLANALMSNNAIMEAIKHYKEALALNTSDAAAYMNLGVAYKHLNMFEDALEYFKKSLELRPTADEHYNMANTYVKLTPPNNEEAIWHYKEALKIDPAHANCHQNLGLALKNIGHLDAAIMEMKQAVKKGGTDANFNYNLGNALFAKGTQGGKKEALREAVDAFTVASSIKPDDPDVRTNLGITLMEMGRSAEAIQQYQEVMRLQVRGGSEGWSEATAEEKESKATKEQHTADRIANNPFCSSLRSSQPGDGLTHYNCGNAFIREGLTDQAIEQYSEALILLPNHHDSAYNLGMTLMQIEKYEEAIKIMEDLLLWEDEGDGGDEDGGEGEREGQGEIEIGGGDNGSIHYNLGTMKGKVRAGRQRRAGGANRALQLKTFFSSLH